MLATRMRMASGVWDGYLYKEGNEYEHLTGGWVHGYTRNANYSQSKESDHLYAKVSSSVNWDANNVSGTEGVRTWVTDELIDLTEFNQIKIQWANIGVDHSSVFSTFAVSPNKTGNYTDYTERVWLQYAFDREDVIDISSLSGGYYVRVHARGRFYDGSYDLYCELLTKRIWLE